MATLLLNQPLYEGSAVSAEVPYPFHCAIGGHGYFIDTEKMARTTIETIRQGFDPSGEPGEQTLSNEGIWKRYGDDWSYGAGQVVWDTQQSDRRRFYTSQGIDPWSERGEISLLGDTSKKLNSSNTNLLLLTAGSYFYVADGSNLKHTTDPSGASPSFTTVAMGGAITSITTDGAKVYAAIGTDVEQSTVGSGSKSVLSTQDADLVGYANGRLLAAHDAVLYEISSAGTATAIHTHFNSSVVYVAIIGTPSGIFVGLNNGERGEFLYVGFNATTGSLAVPLHAGTLNRGETLHAMHYYQGQVILGTSRGLRLAEIVQDRGLAPGPVIEATSPVRCLDVDGEYTWFGLTNYASGTTGVGRANLARPTTHPLVPAYASDLMAASTTGNVLSVARFAQKTYFSVSASGVWGPNGNKVASGTIDSGWVRFGTVERLVLYNVDLFHEPLDGSISVAIVEEAGTQTSVGQSAVADSVAPADLLSGRQIDSYAFRVVLTLARDGSDATAGPTLLRWILRAIVAPIQIERIVLPVLLYRDVVNEHGEGQEILYDVQGEWAYLKGLEASRQVVQFQLGLESIPVTVRLVQTPEGAFRGWGDNRAYLDQTVYVHLSTLEA